MSKHIIINSIDRDWTNSNSSETPYNYRVVFGNNSLYGNTSKNLNILINENLKNVEYFSCQKLVISNRELSNKFRPSNNPYLLLNVDNIEQVSDASNNKLQNALSIMTPKEPMITGNNNCKYLEYSNINNHKKKINRNITYLDVKIQKGDGTLINYDEYQNDILNIEQIYYDTSNTLLQITTGDFFSDKDFEEGDIIKIKNYNFRESSLNYYETALFNDYINREQGHIIQSINQSNSSLDLYDRINILPAGENSRVTGNFELKSWFDDLITKTNIDSNLANDNSGKLINFNLQTSIFLEVNEKDYSTLN